MLKRVAINFILIISWKHVFALVLKTTSNGLADPVTNATVEQTSNVCTVVIPPDETGQVIAYRVTATSSVNVTYHDYNVTTTDSKEELKVNISMEPHGSNERVDIWIQAFTCEGPNEWEPVEGFCVSPEDPASGTPVGVIVGSVCGAVVFLALCAGGLVYLHKQRNVLRKQNKVTFEDFPARDYDVDEYQIGRI